MRNLIGGLLAELEDDIDRDKFKRLLHYSRRLSAFQNRARLVRFFRHVKQTLCLVLLSGPRSPRGSAGTRSANTLILYHPNIYKFNKFLDEDLAAMYLSDKKSGNPRSLSDHEELEVLLESFSKQVEEIVNEAETISVCYGSLESLT